MAPTRRTTKASPATTTTTTPVTNSQLKELIDQGVANALAARDADKSWNGDDSHNSRTGSKRTERTTRECTYTEFLKCQPMNFKVENQVKFATCTLHGIALTWWKSHFKTVSQGAARSMSWSILMKMMTTKYCPRNEIQKLEMEILELKVKRTDVTSYTQRFQELALMCGRMFPEGSDKIKKYVDSLSDMIHGSVMASKPNTMHDAIEFVTELIDKKICTFAERQTKNKRKQDDNQQQQNKRQNTDRAYTVGPEEKKSYGGSKPLCSKYNYHHNGLCAPKCHKRNQVGHLTQDCRSPTATNNYRNLTCYECENPGHHKSDCQS
nr:hypothetical protein [Tanacetum cinerariifolium]